MNELKINRTGQTLVDQVEEKLIEYFKEQGLRPGASIPNESELAAALGIGRTVLREALSRFKMTGMIESRTKRGMVLAEPSILTSLSRQLNPLLMTTRTLRDIFELRIVIELGITGLIFKNMTTAKIKELEEIVDLEETMAIRHPDTDQCLFHDKLYEISNNGMIQEFQNVLLPVLEYIMIEYKDSFEIMRRRMESKGQLITHRMLLEHIKKNDEAGYREAIAKHFEQYSSFLDDKEVRGK